MLVQALLQFTFTVLDSSVGVEYRAFFARFVAISRMTVLRRVVMIGQHQGHARKMQDKWTLQQLDRFSLADQTRALQDCLCHLGRVLTPVLAVQG